MTPRMEGCSRGRSASCIYSGHATCPRAQSTYGYVNHLQPVCIANQVVGEHYSSLQAGVRPSSGIGRLSNVEASYCDSLDLVALLGDEALDSLLVCIVEDRRHGGSGLGRRNRGREGGGLVESEMGQAGIVDSQGWCLLLASGRLIV